MGCDINQQAFVQAAQSYINRANDSAGLVTATKDAQRSLQQGGLQELILPDLSSIGIAGNVDQFRYESSGVALYFCKSGSQPGAEFSVEMTGGKTFTKVVPGTKIVGNFDGFNLTNTGVRAGTSRFVVIQRDGLDYNEENIESALSGTASFAPIVAGRSVGYNSAINVNIPAGSPSVAQACANLRGANAVRVWVNSATAITAFSIRYWLWSDTLGAWFCSGQGETITLANNGGSRGVSSDWQVGVKEGFVFAELYANTNLGGTGAFSYFVEVL